MLCSYLCECLCRILCSRFNCIVDWVGGWVVDLVVDWVVDWVVFFFFINFFFLRYMNVARGWHMVVLYIWDSGTFFLHTPDFQTHKDSTCSHQLLYRL